MGNSVESAVAMRRPYLTIRYSPEEPTINFRTSSYQNHELYDKLLKTHRSGTDMDVLASDPVKAEVYQILGEHIGFDVRFQNELGQEMVMGDFFVIFTRHLRELDLLRVDLEGFQMYRDSDVNPFCGDRED